MNETEISQQWRKYYEATLDRPPRDTLLRALTAFEAETRLAELHCAIDLGAGNGIDTIELLRRGWKVLAIDREPSAIEWVRRRAAPNQLDRLETKVSSLEEVELPAADLVNASYSLPFCSPQSFDSLWSRIQASVRSGGRFAGNLFGDRDGWSTNLHMTFHTIDQAKQLLSMFEIEFFLEEESDGVTALGDPKHWHTYSIAARKI